MTLATRLSAFFLVSLAAILLALSAGLYAIAHFYLYQQAEERLATALDTLEAAVDVEPGGLEWEPLERRITLGVDPGIEQVRWMIVDGDAQPVDSSANVGQGGFPQDWLPQQWPTEPSDAPVFGSLPGWQLAGKRLLLADLLRLGRGHEEDDLPDDDVEYPSLIITAGLSRAPIEANLRRLAIVLVTLSGISLIVCAALGRGISRRALVPVTRMAAAARQMTSSRSRERLPTPGTRDELDDLGRAFNELLARRDEPYERERRFTAEASHQLRTPLAGLLSLVDVTRRRSRSTEEYEAALDQVRSEAIRLQQIIEALMFLARAESEGVARDSQPFDLVEWLPRQVERWQTLHPDTPVQIQPLDGLSAWVSIEPSLLAELIGNLLDNAAKYSPHKAAVSIELAHSSGQVVVTIGDKGEGIPAEDLPLLFEPFFRGASARERGIAGTGLGLPVARRIARSFGGEVVATSVPGQGSRFSLKLSELHVAAIPSPRSDAPSADTQPARYRPATANRSP